MEEIRFLLEKASDLLNNSSDAVDVKEYINKRIPKNIQDEYLFGYLPANEKIELLTDVFSYKYLEKNGVVYKKKYFWSL